MFSSRCLECIELTKEQFFYMKGVEHLDKYLHRRIDKNLDEHYFFISRQDIIDEELNPRLSALEGNWGW